ncbi:hypothetical protein [Leuconostoc lactis]|uniref:hypothetical protein n=1 Tax=Leuconostoc lactis TaxID=1246 RepID=UPI0028A20F28|nr:hypothetical protein [Leuconostoc lactis]
MRTTTDYKQLNIKDVAVHIRSGRSYVNYYGNKIKLTTTSPNYGGVRYWFVCPICDERKAVLYNVRSSMACRQCANLYYPLQEKKITRDPFYKLLHYDKLLMKAKRELNPEQAGLVCSPLQYGSLADFTPDRPKGMHHSTYARKLEYIDALVNRMAVLVNRMTMERQIRADKARKQFDEVLKQQNQYFEIG